MEYLDENRCFKCIPGKILSNDMKFCNSNDKWEKLVDPNCIDVKEHWN